MSSVKLRAAIDAVFFGPTSLLNDVTWVSTITALNRASDFWLEEETRARMQKQGSVEIRRQVPVIGAFDVLVVGGGFPGVCAALAAARVGVKTAIVERDGHVGGQAAAVYTLGLDGFLDRNGRHYAKGIPWEILTLTLKEKQSDPFWDLVDHAKIARSGLFNGLDDFAGDSELLSKQSYVNPAAFRYVMLKLLREEGVTILYESPVCDVTMEGDRITGVVACADYGNFALQGQAIVDTTPQALIGLLAGKPFPFPGAYTGSHPRVAGVDIHCLLDYAATNPDDVTFSLLKESTFGIEKKTAVVKEIVQRGIAVLMTGFSDARSRAIADDPIFSSTGTGNPPQFRFYYDRDGCGTYWLNVPEARNTALDDPYRLSEAISLVREQQWLTHKLFRDYVPGFQNAHLMDLHPHVARSLHITREPGGYSELDIEQDHIDTGDDRYDDSIARVMGHPNTDQAPNGFQVPYRSLIPRGLDGVLITGKPACRFFHYNGTMAVLGQAAGTAAALAVKEGRSLRELDVQKVREELENQQAIVS